MKLCIAGVGRMGLRHIAVAKSVGFEIAGISDPLDAAVRTALEQHQLPPPVAFASAGEMLETVKPDAFVVASTATSHCAYVCKAAASGVRYILCEKPMAVSLDECDRMIAACGKAGAKLAVNHQMRYMDQYARVHALVRSAEFGGLNSMTVAASNIGFSMNGSHYFEAFRYLTGEEVISVNAWLDEARLANPRGPQFEDRSGQLRGVTASGKRLTIELGGDLGHGLLVIYGCRHGQIFSDQLAGVLRTSHRSAPYRDLPTSRYDQPADEATLSIEPANILSSTAALWRDLLENRSYPDGNIGRYTVSAVVAANLSGEQGGIAVRLADADRHRTFAWA